MIDFAARLKTHSEHVKKVGPHCSTEETTKQALILPFLDMLGFSPFDPTKVQAEYRADFPGVKAGERVDYALFCRNIPVMFIEAKPYEAALDNHCPQLSRYFNATPEVSISAITNGREWRFFTDLKNKNMMDGDPFLTVNFSRLDETLLDRLKRFTYDEFEPEALRTLAEETMYLNAFTDAISSSLSETDQDFVRYVAGKANIQRQFTAKFLDEIKPLVRLAVERAVSGMVVSGLYGKRPESAKEPEVEQLKPIDPKADIIDPNNPKIVTTYAERQLLSYIREILGTDDLEANDTETYFSVILAGKKTRWLVRYYENRRIPAIQFCVPMTDERKHEIERSGLTLGAGDMVALPKPEDILRLSCLLFDVMAYCSDDSNYRRGKETEPT